MDNSTTPKYNFKKHTRHDSPWWQPIYSLQFPVSKREAKIKNQAGFFVFDKFTLQVNLGDESGVNWPFKHTFSHHVSGKQYYEALFYHSDLGQNLFAQFKPIILQFFTILQDKLHSFNIQDDQSTCFLCATNCSIDHIRKRLHEENSQIMPGLFS